MHTIETLLESLQGDAPVSHVLVGAFWTAVVLETNPPHWPFIRMARQSPRPDASWSAAGGSWPDGCVRPACWRPAWVWQPSTRC